MSTTVSTPVKARGVALYTQRTARYGSPSREASYVARPISQVSVNVTATYTPRPSVTYGLMSREPVFSSFLQTTYSARQTTLTTNRSIPADTDDDFEQDVFDDETDETPVVTETILVVSETTSLTTGDVHSKPNVAAGAADYPLIGLIASKNPVSALVLTVQSLFDGGATRVIVVDDGSDDPESLEIFDLAEAAGAEVIHLKKNVGKSKALKRGFRKLPKRCIIVQTDDDTLAGNLTGPARLIREGKADIVDIRIETTRTHSLLGLVQELDYWLINAISKRLQDFFRARLWMSGASVMYSYAAGRELILEQAKTMTEDTEGLFRARTKGWKVRYYSKHEGQFLTMVPEDMSGLHKQWKRWSTGNGQVISLYGLGGGNPRIAIMNILAWFDLIVLPIAGIVHSGIGATLLWGSLWGIGMGIVGAIRLKRLRIAWVGMFLPYVSALWAIHAVQGLFLAYMRSRSGAETSLTWVSPKRTVIDAVPAMETVAVIETVAVQS